MIPMLDLKAQYTRYKNEIDAAVLDVLASGHYILGPHVQAFETEAAHYLGVKHAITLNSGTDALYLALMAENIKPGDEIITTPFSFIAAAEAIRYLGATPVFVDADPKSFNIDIELLEAAITPATKAVIPVHLYGQSADLDELMAICKKHNLLLIEDAAQSFGSRYKGKMTGTLGHSGCFSFYPTKNLGGIGDGGLVVTHSDELAETLRALRNHGSKVRYEHTRIGINSRLDEIQAAVLRIKLKHIDEFNQARYKVAQLYTKLLSGLPVQTPHELPNRTHIYHQYTLLTEHRAELIAALTQAGIASSVHYPKAIHRQPIFEATYKGQSFPVSEMLAARCLCLPIFPEMTEAQVHEVVNVIRSVLVGK